MVCQDCKSTDIVAINGSDFCVDCGQRVAPAQKAPRPTRTKPRIVSQDAPKIRITTIKKTPSKPNPTTKTIVPTLASPKITVKTKAAEPKPEPVTAVPARTFGKAATLDLRSTRAGISKRKSQSARLSDVRINRSAKPEPRILTAPISPVSEPEPLQPVITPVKSEEPAALAVEEVISAPVIEQPLTPAKPVFSGEGSALVFAWRQLGNWRFLLFGLLSALISGLTSLIWKLNVDTVTLYQTLQASPRQLIGTSLLTNVTKFGSIIIGTSILIYLVHLFAANTITYAAAKVSDGRTAKLKSWMNAGLASVWGVVRLDLALLPLWLCLAALETTLLWFTVYSGSLAQTTRLAILIPAHLILLYLAIGLIFIRLLGGYAIVLGDIEVSAAIRLGWRLYRHRPLALVVSGVIGSAVTAIIYLPALAIDYANRDLAASATGLNQTLATAGFTAILSALSLVFVTSYFLKQYRRSVLDTIGHSRPQLFSGREPKPIQSATKIAFGLALVVMGAIALIGYLDSGVIRPTLEQLLKQYF
jgi:hypothetical protein